MTQKQIEESTPSEASSALQETGMRSRLFSGLRWSGASQALQQVLNLGCSIVLARLLIPEDFGILSMTSVFTGIVFLVLDLGLSAAIIQRKTLRDEQISSVFWLNLAAGLVMTVIGIMLSSNIAAFYQNPAVQPIVVALSFNFFLFSLSTTQSALLTRKMDFQTLELRTLTSHAIGAGCAIALAFLGAGVWSLVARILVVGLVSTVLLWSVCGWRPTWRFRWNDIRDLVGFSNDVFAGNLLSYVRRNADNLLIGRFVGAVDLGFYALAYNLMMFPVLRLSQVVASVLFPALSRIQDDLQKLSRGWFRAVRMIAAITAPMMIGLIVLAPPFVRVVYGSKWIPVIPLLQILAVSGIVQSLGWLNGTVLLALGRSRLRLKLTVLSVVLAVASFLAGLQFGILGVAACFTVVNAFTTLFELFVTLRCLGFGYIQYFRNLSGVVAAAVGMGLALLGLVHSLPLPDGPLLGLAIAFGIVIYVALLRFAAPALMQEALQLLPERITRRWLRA